MKTLAEKASEQADVITAEFELRPEITPQVVKLAFYDFVILCGTLFPLLVTSSLTFVSLVALDTEFN